MEIVHGYLLFQKHGWWRERNHWQKKITRGKEEKENEKMGGEEKKLQLAVTAQGRELVAAMARFTAWPWARDCDSWPGHGRDSQPGLPATSLTEFIR